MICTTLRRIIIIKNLLHKTKLDKNCSNWKEYLELNAIDELTFIWFPTESNHTKEVDQQQFATTVQRQFLAKLYCKQVTWRQQHDKKDVNVIDDINLL